MQPNNALPAPESLESSIVLVPDALAPEALRSLRARLVLRGFRATAGRYPGGYRDNDRLVFDDPELAAIYEDAP